MTDFERPQKSKQMNKCKNQKSLHIHMAIYSLTAKVYKNKQKIKLLTSSSGAPGCASSTISILSCNRASRLSEEVVGVGEGGASRHGVWTRVLGSTTVVVEEDEEKAMN